MAKSYAGGRVNGQARVVVIDDQGERLLDPAYHLKCLAVDGFDWGHSGRGSAQLALAMLADALGDGVLALGLYEAFCEEWVRKAQRGEWVAFADQVREWADKKLGIGTAAPIADEIPFGKDEPAELPAPQPDAVAPAAESEARPHHKKKGR